MGLTYQKEKYGFLQCEELPVNESDHKDCCDQLKKDNVYKKVEIAKIKIEPKVEIAKIEPLRREISKPSSHTMVSEKSKTNIITSKSKDDDEWESF